MLSVLRKTLLAFIRLNLCTREETNRGNDSRECYKEELKSLQNLIFIFLGKSEHCLRYSINYLAKKKKNSRICNTTCCFNNMVI